MTATMTLKRGTVLLDPDDEAFASQWRWLVGTNGYAQRTSGRRTLFLHRELMGLEYGDGRMVDHRNGNRLDCRRENLRIVDATINAANRLSEAGSSSRYTGVTWHAQCGKWQAQVARYGRNIYLGLHDTEEAAYAAIVDAGVAP